MYIQYIYTCVSLIINVLNGIPLKRLSDSNRFSPVVFVPGCPSLTFIKGSGRWVFSAPLLHFNISYSCMFLRFHADPSTEVSWQPLSHFVLFNWEGTFHLYIFFKMEQKACFLLLSVPLLILNNIFTSS